MTVCKLFDWAMTELALVEATKRKIAVVTIFMIIDAKRVTKTALFRRHQL